MPAKKTLIERAAESIGLIKKLERSAETIPGEPILSSFPPPEKWNEWEEYDATKLPEKVKRKYSIVPTTCFNCEAACGLLAYVDKETGKIRKFEGNPFHPASRGRLCSKGPATINQINDTDRILYPMKQVGKRGSGKWVRVTWEEALTDIGAKIRKAISEKRNNEIAYHVGRPGEEGFMFRVLNSWGVDGHNSHTNICSSGARFGYSIWQGSDRPSPDYANAKFILLLSAHLESGHYFNPHSQRIMEAKAKGARLCVIDPRLSNTAAKADYWLPTYPGTEAALFLAIANIILKEGLYNREFIESWVNWQEYLGYKKPGTVPVFEDFIQELISEYKDYTPQFAAGECGIDPSVIPVIAREIAAAGTHFACHSWRSSCSGNLGGWQTTRSLHFISVLTGAVGCEGGTLPNDWNKYKPVFHDTPPAHAQWNELHFPPEYPLSHYEMSQILPHLLKENKSRLEVYFTRVFNPVWTYPDGFSWIEVLQNTEKIGLHVALTPTWNETAYFADYVLPMGHASERHDLNCYETHQSLWIAFRQPVLREFMRREGRPVRFTYEANPGEVWEENEFFFELSWHIDPDGSMGIRKHFESPVDKGERLTTDEYYSHIFNQVPGLSETAEKEGITALDYMKRYGAFEIKKSVAGLHEKEVAENGVLVGGKMRQGFNTPSKKQEFFSKTLVDWKWKEHAIPGYIRSHVLWKNIDYSKGEFPLVPTFRLPAMIHTRSGNAKWLAEICNRNPVWMNTIDATRLGVKTNDIVKVYTDIGYFVDKVWVTESIRPGVVACSHHLGRWRRSDDPQSNRWVMNTISIEETEKGKYRVKLLKQVERYKSEDKDSEHIFWKDGGVHQNITFPVHPDPISGMHCWHQKVRIEKAGKEDHYGDIFVDTNKSFEIYKEWKSMTRPAPGPDNLRRPLWLNRPLKPVKEAYFLNNDRIT